MSVSARRSGDPVRRKLALLQRAEELGNVSAACREAGYSRQQFYQIRESFARFGAEGLVDRRPGPRGPHPSRVPPAVEAAVLAHVLRRPQDGPRRTAAALRASGIEVGVGGVRGVLARHGLRTRIDRAHRLAEVARDRRLVLDEVQLRALEWADPELRDRHVTVAGPGRRLAADVFVVPAGQGRRVHLHLVLDCYSRLAWTRLLPDRRPLSAVQLLAHEVLPFFERHGIPVWTVATDATPAFTGRPDVHPFASFLRLEGIEHVTVPGDGFVERFRRIFEAEHVTGGGHPAAGSLDEMREALGAWTERYNRWRPHDGRGMEGRTPRQMFEAGPRVSGESAPT